MIKKKCEKKDCRVTKKSQSANPSMLKSFRQKPKCYSFTSDSYKVLNKHPSIQNVTTSTITCICLVRLCKLSKDCINVNRVA